MPEDVVSIRIEGRGAREVAGDFRRVGRALDRTTLKATTTGRALRASVRGVRPIVRNLGAALGGLGVAAGAKRILTLQEILAQIQVDSQKTNEEMAELARQAQDAGKQFGFVSQEVATALKTFQDFGGILDFGQQVLDQTLLFSKAAGIAPEAAATIVGTLKQSLNAGAKEIPGLLNALLAQARAGTLNPEQISRVLPELLSAGAGLGFQGQRGATQLGSALQIAGQAFAGRPEQAKTATLALLRDIFKQAGKLRERFGVSVLDDKDEIRNVEAIMRDIFVATRGQITGRRGLQQIFTDESIKAALAFKNSFNQVAGRFEAGSRVADILRISNAALRDGSQLARDYQLRLKGIGKEAEQVKRFWADVDDAIQTHGANILRFISDNPVLSAVLGIGGFAGLKIAGGALSGIGAGLAGGAAGTAGAAAGAGAGIAGSIASGLAKVLPPVMGAAASEFLAEAQLERDRAMSQIQLRFQHLPETQRKQLARLAGQFGALRAQGAESVEGPGGQRVQLTQQGIVEALQRNADQLKLSREDFREVLPKLQAIVRRASSTQGPGLDAARNAAARGL